MEEERGRGNRGSKCKRCVLSSLRVDSRVESVECLSVCVCLKASMPGFGRALNRIRFKWIGGRGGEGL